MTSKTLTGTYASGYTLHSGVTDLTIASGGYVQGTGVASPASPAGAYTVTNYGKIVANTTGASGVNLGKGGVVTNGSAVNNTAHISGYRAVEIHNAPGTVTNYGTLNGVTRTAVYMDAGGVVTNGPAGDTSATIWGSNGVIINYSTLTPLSTVINYGTITGFDTVAADGGVGVYLGAGGVDNGSSTDTAAFIFGYSGVEIAGLGVVFNYGAITGFGAQAGLGVYLQRGDVTNGAAGVTHALIRGFIGLAEGAGTGTITNFGTIVGTGGTAVELSGGTQTLVVEKGSAFTGSVTGGGAVLELAAGTGTLSNFTGGGFTLSGQIVAPAAFDGFGKVKIDAMGNFALSGGGGTLAAGQTVEVDGALTATGTLGVAGTLHVVNKGALILAGALTDLGGALTLDTGAELSGQGTVALTAFTDNGLIDAVGAALTFKGASTGAGDLFAGVLEGFEIDFGGLETLGAGSTLTAARVVLLAGAAVQLGVSQAYAGNWRQGAAALHLGAFNLNLSGAGSTIAGLIDGTGTLAFTGGSQTLQAGAALKAARWTLSNGVVVGVQGAVSASSVLIAAAGTQIAIGTGAALTLSGAGCALSGAVTGAGTLAFSGGVASFRTGASVGVAHLSLLAGSLGTTISLTYLGALTEAKGASLLLGANSLTLKGAGSSFAGGVGGVGGTLLLAGGSQSFLTGAAVGVSNWTVQTNAAVSIATRLTYNGTFSLAGAAVTVQKAQTFALVGPSSFGTLSVVNGAGVLALYKTTLTGLTLGGTATLSLVGSADQTGAVTIGDATSAVAAVSITKTGVWKLDGDVGIARGFAAGSHITDSGTLIKSAGTGRGVVAVTVTDSGLVEAASGTLDFTQAFFGSGRLVIDAGATLEFDAAVSNTLTLSFNGPGATLALGAAPTFHVVMSGFAAGNAIDLLGLAATSATLQTGDKLVIANGTKTVATLQLSGTYTGDTFHVASDGHGGSTITVTTPLASFVQQMSALSAPPAAPTPTAPPNPLTPLLATRS